MISESIKMEKVYENAKKIKMKKTIIIIAIFTSLMLSEWVGILQYSVARISSLIYINMNYPDKDFKFDRAEYAFGFGNYFVRYIDNDRKSLGLMMFPKEFPVLIRNDSLKGEG